MNRIIAAAMFLLTMSALLARAADNDAPAVPLKPAAASAMTEDQLKLWNSPAFQKEFTQSYIAETEIEPRVTAEERDEMQKILGLMAADKVDDAVQMILKKRTPASSAVFDFTLANIYFQKEQFDQAIEEYQAAVKKHDKFRRAWKNLGIIFIKQSKFEQALPALTKVIELGGGDKTTYGLLGFAYASIGDNLASESAFRMAILMDPGTMDWKMGLLSALFKQQRYTDVQALCGQLLSDNPNRADLWMIQANAFIGLNDPMKAAQNFEMVDRLGKSTPASLNLLGDIYINSELYGLAVKTYERAMMLDPKAKPDRAIRAAKVLTTRGAMDETRDIVAKIEEIHKDDLAPEDKKDLLKLQARLAVAAGAGEEEAKVLEQIVEIDPLDGEALILLGQHAGRANDDAKAVFYYERAEALPDYEADAKVRHAQLLIGKGKYDEALPLLRRAQQIKPRENIQKYLEAVERIAKSK